MAISTNGQKPLGSLNPFKLAQLLESAAGSKLANVTRLSSGYFLLETIKLIKAIGTITENGASGRHPSSHLSP